MWPPGVAPKVAPNLPRPSGYDNPAHTGGLAPLSFRREGRDVVTLNMNAASLYMKRRRSLRLSRRRRRMPSANRYVIAAKLRLNSCEISAPIDSSSESAPGTVVHCGEEWRPSPRRLAAISSSIARRSVSSIRWGASK